MPLPPTCPDRPEYVLDTKVCLYQVSKNVEGELLLLESEPEECRTEECKTLKTVHFLRLEASNHQPCDSKHGMLLDGRLSTKDLVHAFRDGDGRERGFHAANVRWKGTGADATISFSGITNAGTHRRPVFDDCQPCDARGFMEGRFCGVIRDSQDRRLVNCQLIGTYRLFFDPSSEGGRSAIRGTLEGLVVCQCGGPQCIDFRGFATGAGVNPRTEQGVVFTVRDHTGAPMPTTQIRTDGGFTGLSCGFNTQIQLPAAASAVEVTLVHFARPATVQVFSAGVPGAAAVMAGPQAQAETLRLTGGAIDQVVIGAPQNEALLLQFCFEAR